MGGGGSGTTTQINKTEYPEWVQEAGRKNLSAAYDISNTMLGPYEGQRVANMAPGQLSAIGSLSNNYAMAQPAFAQAQMMASQAGNYQPEQVQAFMNPYTKNVIDASLEALNTQRQTGLNQTYADAIRAKAFGGSRQGIQEGVINAAAQQQAGQLAANLYSQNYDQAQKAALANAGLGLQGAATLGNLAGAGQEAFMTGATGALGAQSLIQQQQQAQLDAARQAYSESQQFPLQQLQIPLSALGATPYGGTQTQTSSGGTSSSGLLTGLGAASSAATILGTLASL